MTYNKKICKECGNEDYIFSKGRCKPCANKSYISKNPIKRTPLKHNRKPTGERALFDSIWASREKKSLLSGRDLIKFEDSKLYVNMFAHLLNKGAYSKFRLLDRNIVLLHPSEHQLLDFGTKEQRMKYAEEWGCDWNKILDLKESLKTEYRELYGN